MQQTDGISNLNPGTAESDSSNGLHREIRRPDPVRTQAPSSGLNGPTFGGGPILGVASASKEKTIHVFLDKNHYKDWLFIYVQGQIAEACWLDQSARINPQLLNLNGACPGSRQAGQGTLDKGLGRPRAGIANPPGRKA